MTIVINVSGLKPAAREELLADPEFVYCGRGSKAWPSRGWGNRFSVKEHGREKAIELHREWLREQVRSGAISKNALASLHGKTLGCHCAPEPCHCDTLVKAAEWARKALAAADEPQRPKAHRDFRYPAEFLAWVEREGLVENPRVLICGEREFAAAEVITEVVAELAPGTVVIEGEARGADLGAAKVAEERGLPLAGFPARWTPQPHTPAARIKRDRNGRPYDVAAGFMRNQRMLECAPSRVIALADWTEPEGGTGDTVQRALSAGIPVEVVSSDGSRRVIAPEAGS